jgi:tetratricopeptide (TPR) repeat protein
MTRAWFWTACVALFLLLPAAAQAENEGLPDLDKASDLQVQISANPKDAKLTDLEKICDLCESAITKGLDADNKKFAQQLLSLTLYEHAARLSSAIFDINSLVVTRQPHPQWPIVRNLAVADLEKSLKVNEKQPGAQVLLARLYALPGGDTQKAMTAADKAVELAKGGEGNLAMALTLRSTLQKEPEKQLADLEEALKASPDNTEALRVRGAVYLAKRDFEKATADFTKVLEKNPEDAVIIGELAESLTNEKKYDEAIKLIDKVIAKNDKNAGGYIARAQVKILQKDDQGALEDLKKAIDAQPGDVTGLMARARYYFSKKEYDKAKSDIDEAMKIRPNMVQGLLMQAELAAQKGNYEQAIETMQLMASADPSNPIWKIQIAQLLSADKRPRAAIELANQVLKEDADNASALRIRGDAYLSIGKHAEAVADLEAALKADPKISGVLNNLAWVLATSPDDAVRNGKRAVELATKACEETEYKRPHILSTLAAAYAESGDFDTAIKWSTKAVELSTAAGDDKTEDDVQEQLKKELEGYKAKKPFREKQETEEKKPKGKTPREDLEI